MEVRFRSKDLDKLTELKKIIDEQFTLNRKTTKIYAERLGKNYTGHFIFTLLGACHEGVTTVVKKYFYEIPF